MPGMDALQAILASSSLVKSSSAIKTASPDLAAPAATAASPTIDNAGHQDEAVLRLVELKKSLEACDQILARVQKDMASFQTDLGAVSADIQTLQQKSDHLSVRLQRRKDAEAVIGPAVDQSILSPVLIKQILEAPVDKHYLKYIEQLESFSLHESKQSQIETSYPASEVDSLSNVAVARIRDYFVNRIKALRVPQANVQIIQQSGLLKVRKLYDFVARQHTTLSDELMLAYCMTMRWYYNASFDRYQRALTKVPIHALAKQDLLGAEEVTRSMGGMFQKAPQAPSVSTSVLALGTRAKYLHDTTSGIILAHLAETSKEPYFLERVFRSYVVALIENASVEYLFMQEFFKTKAPRVVSDQFSKVMEPLLQSATQFVTKLIDGSLDALALLLCIRVVQSCGFALQKRKVAGLGGLLDGLQITLWPKLQQVMDQHAAALKNAPVSLAAVQASARERQPLSLTRKFAEFLAGILQLCRSSSSGDSAGSAPGAQAEEPVQHSLDRLCHDFEGTLARMAAACDPKVRTAFLFRNYLHVSTTIEQATGAMAESHKARFKQVVDSLKT
ncbi:hypothetical protein BCR37DRAFT_376655 [Protomyces lactucae-debilis]|uniref:Sac2 family-domain-containing protein n=1 Tax=Protomyces lactucae-debilis TaxID=2754530 RepID=A0A1Y2FSF4_PROLT|nr:uncharacterized protein BCR37DRAFT_376655 [Protomyces lactucae-debilis]ORY86116.1 hypothetical protein BCR37DRAFT_376655 [Protomyces lactucae-debilis]